MAEKEKEKTRKNGGGKLLFLLVLLLLAAIVYLLIQFGVLGFGGSDFGLRQSGDSGSSVSSQEASESEAEEPAETTVEEKIYVDVTVKESEYLYQNGTMTITELTEALGKLGTDVTVRITDENAAKQAYDALTAELDAMGLAYETAE